MTRLVAYYSRAGENYFGGKLEYVQVGNTEKVARNIASLMNGALFRIEEKTPYSMNYRECTAEAKRDRDNDARPELAALPQSIADFSVIYLGFPNYWGTMPMAVFSFLESFDFTGKTIRPFCTHEGSGFGDALKDLGRVAKGAYIENPLEIRGSLVDSAYDEIRKWLGK